MPNIDFKLLMTIIWIVITIAMIIVEVGTVQMVSLWFAFGALIAAILAAFGVDLYIQLIAFGVVSVILVILTRPFVIKMNKMRSSIAGTAEGLSLETVVILEEVSYGKVGLVQAQYDKYKAITDEDVCFEVGERAEVKELRGNKLVIKKVKENKNA